MGFVARGAIHGLRDSRDRRSVQRITVSPELQREDDQLFSQPGIVTLPTATGTNSDPLGLANQAAARERDFSNQYIGSQIAPNWTAALESLRGSRVAMEPSWARNQGIAENPTSSFNTTGPGSPSGIFGPAMRPTFGNPDQRRSLSSLYRR